MTGSRSSFEPPSVGGEAEIRTFLIADIRGYTLFTQQRGDEAAGKLAAKFAGLARLGVEGRGGSVIELRGDEALAVFGSARQAIRAAVDLQERFVEETLADPSLPLGVGIGLDAGEAVAIEGGYRGGALNLAARLCGVAGPGEVLASKGIVHLARKVEGIRYLDRGEIRLKGLDEPVAAVKVVPEGDDPADRLSTVVAQRAEAPSSPRWSARRLSVVGIALAVLAAAIAIPLALRPNARPMRLTPNTVGLVDPTTERLVGSVAVGNQPRAIVSGEGGVWVANSGAGTVSRIDPNSRNVVQTIDVGGTPAGIAVGDGAVWVALGDSRTVARISPATNSVVQRIVVGNGPLGIEATRSGIWVANSFDDTVMRIDPSSGEVRSTIPVGSAPAGIAASADGVWVTNSADGTVSLIDPTQDSVVQTITVGNGPRAIVVGQGDVWVANSLDGTVSRIDPSSQVVTATAVGDGPSGVAVLGGVVWVANAFSGTVSRISAGGAPVQTVRIGNAPQGLAVVEEMLWVTTASAPGSAHRGGTLRLVSEGVVDSIDPAIAYSPGSWAILSITNDGLVGFRRTGGSEGGTLVPDLATSLPGPTDGGKTYTFQLRSGLRYSTGDLVEPEDVRRAIERELRISGYTFYEGILGADACKQGAPCDLSKGIVTDDATRTITFHLVAPDPEFLYKLALPFADAVPAGVSDQDVGQRSVPATGPYMIVKYVPGQVLVLDRNPEFREWSLAAQPAGYPDHIVWTMGEDAEQAVSDVEQGRADFLFEHPPADRVQELSTRYANQVHLQPLPADRFFTLNTRVPPFDDVRVRRALNFAIDRNRVARLFGGPTVVTPTCQVLPPNFPGYRPYCPYTLHPTPAGSWTAPDRSRAERLIRRSGTAGSHITVWTFMGLDPGAGVGRYLVSLLDSLGYRADLRAFPQSALNKYFDTVSDSSTGAQVALSVWVADYTAASNFADVLLSCGAFVPNSRLNLNVAEFCDRPIDGKIRRALNLQATDPATAGSAWAEIDRQIVDQAPWLFLGNGVRFLFVSARVGNFEQNPQLGVLVDQLWVR